MDTPPHGNVLRDVRDPSSYKILIVDDDEANTKHVQRLLNKHGYSRVETMCDAEELLEELDSLEADAVFLDLHMPGCDGFSVLTQVRERRAGKLFMPIVVLTADTLPETRQRALGLGATDFLTRPVDHDELLLRLKNLLYRRDMHRQIVEANSILEEQIQLNEGELRRAHSEMLVRLARAAEYRDDQTGTHTWRVGYLSRLLAQELSAERRFVDLIGLAARLHDVGKIGIPDRVLLKPGALDDDEFSLMKAHTTIGARLLSGGHTALVIMAESIALNHHEAWDGSGYPNGLAGEQIPRSGRIVAVADVFDALTHSRTYKKGWTEDESFAEIERQKGIKFEPDIVDAFSSLYRNGAISNVQVPGDDDDEISRAAISASIDD